VERKRLGYGELYRSGLGQCSVSQVKEEPWEADSLDPSFYRPIFLFMPVLVVLVAILGLIAVAGSSGTTLAQDQGPAPFTHRAPLDPYRINQPPDFMIHSRAVTDIVMQRSEFPPGEGAWHTHPGPSFVFVEEGQIKLERFSKKDGCTETEVFRPGQIYFEVGNEVHRAVVVSEEPAVLHVTRFNIPVGGATTIPAEDPGCNPTSGGEAGSSDSTSYEEREFNRYDLVIERLENQIDSMLADAALDPSRNTPLLNREIERLDYQIDMLRLHAMQNQSADRPLSSEPSGTWPPDTKYYLDPDYREHQVAK
jgi:quercetin dioxygenase-like cupin family protein